MLRFGTMIGVTFTGKEQAERFINDCNFHSCNKLGGVYTSAERRARSGDKAKDGLVRVSIGSEPAEILWNDRRQVQCLNLCEITQASYFEHFASTGLNSP